MKRILLADDDADDRDLFQEALKDIDGEIVVYCAEDGKSAIEKLDMVNLKASCYFP